MTLFDPTNSSHSGRHRRLWAVTELARTLVDFTAAALFTIGSLLFFSESTQRSATWLFLAGSLLFGVKPTIRLIREVRFLAFDRERRAPAPVDRTG